MTVRRGVFFVIFAAIIQCAETAAKELADLIPAIDWITAVYKWEHEGRFSGNLKENYKKCKKMLRLKLGSIENEI